MQSAYKSVEAKTNQMVYPIQNRIKSMSVFRDENTLKPFLLQNFGIGLGFSIIAILAYAEFNWLWPW